MKIAITAGGYTLDAAPSPVFGRCPSFVFVETDTMVFEAMDNTANAASGGAGVQAAQFIVGQGAEAVISGRFGPNAYNALNAAGIDMYMLQNSATVREAVEDFKAGQLSRVTAPSKGGDRRRGR